MIGSITLIPGFVAVPLAAALLKNGAGYMQIATFVSTLMMEMISVIPPIFILLGLLDVWVDRATMMKYTGKGSGLKGILIAFLLGSAAAGPLYAVFSVAGVMLKKGSSLVNNQNTNTDL